MGLVQHYIWLLAVSAIKPYNFAEIDAEIKSKDNLYYINLYIHMCHGLSTNKSLLLCYRSPDKADYHSIQHNLANILIYWAKRKNQCKEEKSPL